MLVSLYTAGDVAKLDGCDGRWLGTLDDDGQLAGAQAIRRGPDGHLYVVSEENHRILRFDGETLAFLDVWLDDARLGKPTGLVFAEDGSAYVGSYDGDRVLRHADGVLSEFVAGPPLDGVDAGLHIDADGQLWIPSFDSHNVLVVDLATGAERRRLEGSPERPLQSPRMILPAIEGDALLIGAWASNAVYRLDAGAPEPERLFERPRPSGLAWLPDGRLLSISDTGGDVYALDPEVGAASAVVFASDERLTAMTWLLHWPAPGSAGAAR